MIISAICTVLDIYLFCQNQQIVILFIFKLFPLTNQYFKKCVGQKNQNQKKKKYKN